MNAKTIGYICLGVPMAFYVGQGIFYLCMKKYGLATTFFAYAAANIGFIVDLKGS